MLISLRIFLAMFLVQQVCWADVSTICNNVRTMPNEKLGVMAVISTGSTLAAPIKDKAAAVLKETIDKSFQSFNDNCKQNDSLADILTSLENTATSCRAQCGKIAWPENTNYLANCNMICTEKLAKVKFLVEGYQLAFKDVKTKHCLKIANETSPSNANGDKSLDTNFKSNTAPTGSAQ